MKIPYVQRIIYIAGVLNSEWLFRYILRSFNTFFIITKQRKLWIYDFSSIAIDYFIRLLQ